MEKKIKTNIGITLIALVITIIILLILAGITLMAVFGDNGLISRTQQAKIVQVKAEMTEKLNLAIMDLNVKKQGRATLEDITQKWANNEIIDYVVEVKENSSIYGKKIKIEKDNIIQNYIIDEKLNLITEKTDLLKEVRLEKVANYGREVILKINTETIDNVSDIIEKYYIYKNDELIYEGVEDTKKIDKLNFNTNYIFKAKVLDRNGNIFETEELSINTNQNDTVYYNGKYSLISSFSDFNTSSAMTDYTYGRNCERTLNGITFYHLYTVNIGISNLTYSGVNTTEKLDLTNVNTIEFDLKLLNNYSTSSNYETKVYYGISNTKTEDYSNYVKYETVTSTCYNGAEGDCGKNGELKTVLLDVSDYNEEYYIKIVVIHPAIKNYNYEATINKILLK